MQSRLRFPGKVIALLDTLVAMFWNDVASYVGLCLWVRDYIAQNWQWIGSRICWAYGW
jgi:hypothetical protein